MGDEMLSKLHEHVVSELQQSSKTDTVFVVSAVLFNLVVLGINWGVATASHGTDPAAGNDWILGVLVIATLLINTFAVRALVAGRHTRVKLISGLMSMYKDNGIEQYYDPSTTPLSIIQPHSLPTHWAKPKARHENPLKFAFGASEGPPRSFF